MSTLETPKRRGRKAAECRCNTGSYCAVHQQYSSHRTSIREDRDHADDTHEFFQQCGGGRRVLRKHIGGD